MYLMPSLSLISVNKGFLGTSGGLLFSGFLFVLLLRNFVSLKVVVRFGSKGLLWSPSFLMFRNSFDWPFLRIETLEGF